MRIRLRRINGEDIELEYESIEGVTVASLRRRIANMLSISDLQSIRLIHAGRVMVDEDDRLLSYYAVEDGSVVHLVLRNPNTSISSSSTTAATAPPPQPATTQTNTTGSTTARPTPANQPHVRYQQIGNGILMGSIELTGEEALSFINSLGTLPIPRPGFSTSGNSSGNSSSGSSSIASPPPLPVNTNSTTIPRENIDPIQAATSAASVVGNQRPRLVARPRYSQYIEDSIAALDILGEQLHNPQIAQSFQSLEENYSTNSSLCTALTNLSLCLSSIQVPVQSVAMRLSNGRFLAPDANQAVHDRVSRSQELHRLSMTIRALSLASRTIADALDAITISSDTGSDGVSREISQNPSTGASEEREAHSPAAPPAAASQDSDSNPTQQHVTPPAETIGIEPSNLESNADEPAMMVDRDESDDEDRRPIPNSEVDEVSSMVDQFMETLQEQMSSQLRGGVNFSSSSLGNNAGIFSQLDSLPEALRIDMPSSFASSMGRLAAETWQQAMFSSTTPVRAPRSNVQSNTGTPPPSMNSPDNETEDSSTDSNLPLD